MSNVFASISFAGLAGVLGVTELATPGSDYVTTHLAAVGSTAAGITGLIIAVNALLKRLQAMNDIAASTLANTSDNAEAMAPRAPWITPPKAVVVALLASLSIFAGVSCNATPTTKILALREAYIATLEAAVEARQRGLIDDATYERIDSKRILARATLDALEASIGTRHPPTTGQLEAASQAVAAFAKEVNQ